MIAPYLGRVWDRYNRLWAQGGDNRYTCAELGGREVDRASIDELYEWFSPLTVEILEKV